MATPRNSPKALYSCENCRKRKIRCRRPDTSNDASSSSTSQSPSSPSTGLASCIPCTAAKLDCVTKYERSKRGPHGPRQTKREDHDTGQASPITPARVPVPSTAPATHPFIGGDAFAGQDNPYTQQNVTASSSSNPFGPFSSPSLAMSPAVTRAGISDSSLSFTGIVSMDFVIYVTTLHFEYVWPLIPLLHRPTFMQQLQTHKDHPTPQFFSLLMSLLALSLIQIPKSLIPETSEPVSQLATRCYEASRSVSLFLYDPPSVEMIILRFYDSAFNTLMGRRGASVTAHGEALKLVVLLELHREESYAGLDPVDTEMRRRVFSMVYYTDKSTACFWNQTVTLRGEDCDAHLPLELDDENFDRDGYYREKQIRLPVVTCHNILYRLFDLIGRILELRRVMNVKDKPAKTIDLSMLGSLASLCTQMKVLMASLPPELALAVHSTIGSSPQVTLLGDVIQAADGNLASTFASEMPASYVNWNGFASDMTKTPDVLLPQKGNIHAIIAVARLLIIFARDTFRDGAGSSLSIGRNALDTVLQLNHPELAAVSKLEVVTDLVQVLRTIPIVSLAVNSHSLINKLRFTATALLPPEALNNPLDFMLGDLHPDKMALVEILMILTDIDQNLVDR